VATLKSDSIWSGFGVGIPDLPRLFQNTERKRQDIMERTNFDAMAGGIRDIN
jgi:hypothetical protein